MAQPASSMALGVSGSTVFIKIAGRAAAESARDFKAALLRLQTDGVRHCVLDLNDTRLMDSTFAGVLAGLAGAHFDDSNSLGGLKFTLVGATERIRDVLDNLGVLALMHSIEPGNATAAQALPELQAIPLTQDKAATTGCCYEAHEILMKLKPENVAKFQTLQTFLRQELANAGK
jgi:anti-anti-sigma factor